MDEPVVSRPAASSLVKATAIYQNWSRGFTRWCSLHNKTRNLQLDRQRSYVSVTAGMTQP